MILVTITTDTDYAEWFINDDNDNAVREFLNSLPDPQMEKMKNA